MALTALPSWKLLLYNGALGVLGEDKITSTEDRNPRRALDNVWDTGALDFVLESGEWTFAVRTQRIDYNPAIEPDFGFQRAFDMPDDCLRLVALSSDEYFLSRFTDRSYHCEGRLWYSDIDTIYARFVSNDAAYGADQSLWSPAFREFLEYHLAYKSCKRITRKEPDDRMERKYRRMLSAAKGRDAMNQGTKIMPLGSWAGARFNRKRYYSETTGGEV